MTIETANRLYELRKKHGLSQEELAEKLGVSRQAVSKWERSEASPDTDNLISLAKIYGLTLDELVFGQRQAEQKEEASNNQEEPMSEEKKETHKVDIGPMGIFVESNDGDKVQINLKGIKVTESAKEKYENSGVKIDLGGIKIGSSADFDFSEDFDFSKDFDDDDDDDDDEDEDDEHNPNPRSRFWKAVPYPIICAALYLLFGCYGICGGWGKSWIIFITIPLYYSLVDVIFKRRLTAFAYPVFTAWAYLYLGLYHGNWHPSWLVFFTVPIFYPIAKAIDKTIQTRQNKKEQNNA
ncbi:MAG: helix-turn-helix domain-containing protein [Clostridia bacterium]|nr:helix-turn-helix domain-containing protein [Clostridia bacterium]